MSKALLFIWKTEKLYQQHLVGIFFDETLLPFYFTAVPGKHTTVSTCRGN